MRRLVLVVWALAACQPLELSETEQEVVVVTPVSHDFGMVQIGSTTTAFTIAVNPAAGANDDVVTAVTASCPDFVVDAKGLPADVYRTCLTGSGSGCFVQCPVACTTDEYLSYTFTVAFQPKVAGAVSCVVDVVTNNVTHHNITMTGTGLLPPVQINVTPSSGPFGDVRRNTSSTAIGFVVKNLGGMTMIVSGASLPAGYVYSTTNMVPPFNVAPGASVTYGVQCHPTAVGATNGNFTISSNDPVTPTKNIALTCNGIDSNIDIAPSPAVLATTRVGEPVTKQIAITNMGTASSTLQAVTVTGGMSMISGPPPNTVLGVGATTNVMVSFEAAVQGTASSTLQVTYDAGQIRTAQISADALATSMSLNPDGDVDFGPVCIGQNKLQTFTILANDAGAFKIQQMSVPTAPFTLAPPALPATVQGAGANTISFSASVTPTIEGDATSAVQVDTDIPLGAPRMINLKVTGLTAGVTPTPALLDLGSNPINTTTLGQPVRLSNCSTGPITASNARIEGPDAADFSIVSQPDNLMIPPTGIASWLVILNAHSVGLKQATFAVDYEGGTSTIELEGEGLGNVGPGNTESYYACSTGRSTALWPIALACAFLVRRRRR